MTGAEPCGECGARGCAGLFHGLLALDHSRAQPWGPLHGVSVSCFLLQHPGRLPGDGGAGARGLLRAYLDGGLPAVERLVGRTRRANSHRVPGRPPTGAAVRPGGEAPRGGFAVTIEEVAVDGTFPADGFPERVRAWAAATLAAWGDDGA
ncbi:DUF5946 family protein [Streptomyces sp. CBMA123]|uniref:DUF5946 family protein n=1 Tax=Streptomyces sp. CBMA123 TaxID=1896313 RepID=UPI001E16F9EE|nr:DUF5946 family protein [Streptomyces sp. CBMA123]MBD0691782.1 hypothetical protein [Streptomyces sp. CBMA123]